MCIRERRKRALEAALLGTTDCGGAPPKFVSDAGKMRSAGEIKVAGPSTSSAGEDPRPGDHAARHLLEGGDARDLARPPRRSSRTGDPRSSRGRGGSTDG